MQQISLGKLLALLCCTLIVGCKHPNETAQESAIASKQARMTYTCDNHFVVIAAYDNHDLGASKVTLTISGVKYHLTQTVSASGVRYITKHGLTPEHGLIWHSKGHEAIASTFIDNVKAADNDEKVLFSCQSDNI